MLWCDIIVVCQMATIDSVCYSSYCVFLLCFVKMITMRSVHLLSCCGFCSGFMVACCGILWFYCGTFLGDMWWFIVVLLWNVAVFSKNLTQKVIWPSIGQIQIHYETSFFMRLHHCYFLSKEQSCTVLLKIQRFPFSSFLIARRPAFLVFNFTQFNTPF